ncbi:MAG: hypothetical protein HY913_19115 [Desulfomonile tiedjei]|nr:hypothetical protein [Desulfomonile tiedjei]
MVKRTFVVLGVLSLMLMAAGTSFAMFGWGGGCGADCGPMYVPVDCPPVPGFKTIVKTWEAKIEGPCPAPMACGPAACGDKKWGPGLICSLVAAIATPMDWIFGGCDGVYGCFPGFGGGGCGAGGDCGPCFGPLPCALAAVPMVLGAPSTMFEQLW